MGFRVLFGIWANRSSDLNSDDVSNAYGRQNTLNVTYKFSMDNVEMLMIRT